MLQDQFSKWNSIKVKARFDYLCAKCGSTNHIQAHDPTGTHKDWHNGIALCGECHSKEHPNIPHDLFTNKMQQPYWSNISARQLAKELHCHSRTIIRRAKKLGIPIGQPLSEKDKNRLLAYITIRPRNPNEPITQFRNRLGLSQKQLAQQLDVAILTIRRWEHGQERMHFGNKKRLEQLAKTVDIPITE